MKNHIVCMWINITPGCVSWGGTHPSKIADLNNIQLCIDVQSLPDGIYQFRRLGKLYGFIGGEEPVYVSFCSRLLDQIPRAFTLCVESGVVTAAEQGAYFAAVAISNSETLNI
jgi:hypothetical protein